MQKHELKVLIVDDELELRKSVAAILTHSLPQYSFQIHEAENGLEALTAVEKEQFDLVLMDVRMPEMNGLEALEKIKNLNPRTFVVIMTAHANLQDAVAAIKAGAYDYVEKPVQAEKLSQIISKALETQTILSNLTVSLPIHDDDVDSDIVGSSHKMKEIFHLINRLSHVDTTVLIRGESGTGKELVARAIHLNSPRKNGDFVAINCAAIPDDLLESELFGHEKGAFTGAEERKIGKFQVANKGTLFLDEIAELKPDTQAKLLRVLQERKFIPVGSHREVTTNARIIASTHRNLEKMIADGEFREDLFYRLNIMPIFLPSLADRRDDIEDLANHFITKFNRELGRNISGVSPLVLKALKNYRWPGNIRELENVMQRSMIMENSDQIQISSLPEEIQHYSSDQAAAGRLDFDEFKESAEKEFIMHALKANKGRINQTVAQANIPKNTLLRKIKKYNINVKEYIED